MSVSILKRIRFPLLILLAVTELGVYWKYEADNQYLADLINDHVSEASAPSEKVLTCLRFIHENVPEGRTNAAFLGFPPFGPLRPTARQVVDNNGDCADRSRLLITFLHLNDVAASKIALYDAQEMPRHAVVEIEIENDQKMVVDALYGIHFPREDGGFYGVEDIRNDKQILHSRIDTLVAQGYREVVSYPFERYTYEFARTINWDKTWITKVLYSSLSFMIGERVDTIKRPYMAEQPALMVIFGLFILQLVIIATYIGGWVRRVRLERCHV